MMVNKEKGDIGSYIVHLNFAQSNEEKTKFCEQAPSSESYSNQPPCTSSSGLYK